MRLTQFVTFLSWSAVAAGSILTGGCAAVGRPGESSSYLIVDSLQGASGSESGSFNDSLASDVLTTVNGTPTILEDLAKATFRLAMKDPAITTPSPVNYVTLRGYRVTFSRADGRNVQGIDVPFAFDGAMTLTVTGGSASASVVLVRAQAKLEAPLRALAGAGGAIAISTFADIVFYGADQAGHPVTATARISVTFGDWGDKG